MNLCRESDRPGTIGQGFRTLFQGVNIDNVKVQYGPTYKLLDSLALNLDMDRRRRSTDDEPQMVCTENSDCVDDARCANTKYGLRCVCNDGFTGDGEICARVALDACSRLNPCPQNVLCFPDEHDNNNFECDCPENTIYENNDCKKIVPDIVYKYIDAHEFIHSVDTLHSNAFPGTSMPYSFWKVRIFQHDFCSVGDIFVRKVTPNGEPSLKHVVLKEIKEGALARPAGFNLEFSSQKSGSKDYIQVYSMVAPEGYGCLGSVVMKGRDGQPERTQYCCVKTEYLIDGNLIPRFKFKRGAIYSVERKKMDSRGLILGTFQTLKLPISRETGQTNWLLNAEVAGKVQLSYNPSAHIPKDIDVYETQEMVKSFTAPDSSFSVWRPIEKEGFNIVTHHISRGIEKPGIGFIFRASDSINFALPESYIHIKRLPEGRNETDEPSHAFVFSAVCPANYVALGAAITTGGFPKPGEFYCILRQHAIPIISENIQPSASVHLATIEALPLSSTICPKCEMQQGINAIFPAGGNNRNNILENANNLPISPIWILKTEVINYFTEKPISEIIVTGINYEMNRAKYDKKPPENINTLTVINRSHIPQNVAKTVEYTSTESKSYSFGVEIAVGTVLRIFDKKMEAGSNSIEIKIDKTVTYEFSASYGRDTVKETTDTIEVGMEIEWKSKMSATIISEKFTSTIPFTATLKKIYYDGTTSTGKSGGIFKGVHVSNVIVQYSENKPLEPADDEEESAEEESDDTNEDSIICHDPKPG